VLYNAATYSNIYSFQSSGSQNLGRDPNKGRERSKNRSRRGDAKLNCLFSTSLPCQCHSAAYRYLRKENISDFEIELSSLLPIVTHTISIFLNTVFASWVTECPPNSDLCRPRKSLRTTVLKSHYENQKNFQLDQWFSTILHQRTGKKRKFFLLTGNIQSQWVQQITISILLTKAVVYLTQRITLVNMQKSK